MIFFETLAAPVEGIRKRPKSPDHLCANRDEDFIHRVLRDLYSPEVLRVGVDTPAAVARVNAFLGADQGQACRLSTSAESSDILEHYGWNAAIRRFAQAPAEFFPQAAT